MFGGVYVDCLLITLLYTVKPFDMVVKSGWIKTESLDLITLWELAEIKKDNSWKGFRVLWFGTFIHFWVWKDDYNHSVSVMRTCRLYVTQSVLSASSWLKPPERLSENNSGGASRRAACKVHGRSAPGDRRPQTLNSKKGLKGSSCIGQAFFFGSYNMF